MASLYRTHRPQQFSDLVGQPHVVATLQYALTHDQVGHGYLFTGPRGVGKTTVARLLAKAVNCTNLKKGEPCLQCANCTAIARGAFLDLIEIDAASNRGIDEIRDLREKVRFNATAGRYKVFVIDEVHMLTKEAFNALLKTLEEPPAHAIFILATTEPHKVPATIISRVQRFDFHRLTDAQIAQHVQDVAKKEKLKIEPAAAELIAAIADGASRDALSHLEQIIAFAQGEKITASLVQEVLGVPAVAQVSELVSALAKNDRQAALAVSDAVVAAGVDCSIFTNVAIEYLRKLLVHAATHNAAQHDHVPLTSAEEKLAVQQAKTLRPEQLLRWISALLVAKQREKVSPLPQLPLELAICEITAAPETTTTVVTTATRVTASPASEAPTTPTTSVLKKEAPRPKETLEGSPKAAAPRIAEVVNVEPVDPRIVALNLEEVMGKWHDALLQLREKNYTLAGMLRSCWPVELREGQVVLAFKHAFHKERMDQISNRHALEEVLETKLGGRVLVSCVLEAELNDEQKQQLAKRDEILAKMQQELEKAALSIFEGTAVEGAQPQAQQG